MAKNPVVLCINGGSSSLKVGLYRLAPDGPFKVAQTNVEGPDATSRASVERTLARLAPPAFPKVDAVGHRLVHGGPDHLRPERIDAALLSSLRRSAPYAPLHLPTEIGTIEAAGRVFPGIPQVACFDTAFHRDLPEVTRCLPLPWHLYEQGVRRYGFHGLSYEYVVETLGPNLSGRAIVAHLGNGASMAALRDGKPIDTTMGLTPAGGFMMGTRTGDLDPGIVFYLVGLGHTPHDLERMITHESGLLGVSGVSSDMKALLERRKDDPHAALAVDMFCYQASKTVGALTAALGGLDVLVFTGGIGEHAAPIRRQIGAPLGYLGLRVDDARNERAEAVISVPGAPCSVRVLATNEEVMIARHVQRLLFMG